MVGNYKRKRFLWLFKVKIADKEGKGNKRPQKMSKSIEKYMSVRAGRCINGSESLNFLFPSLLKEEDGFGPDCALSPSHMGLQRECVFPDW